MRDRSTFNIFCSNSALAAYLSWLRLDPAVRIERAKKNPFTIKEKNIRHSDRLESPPWMVTKDPEKFSTPSGHKVGTTVAVCVAAAIICRPNSVGIKTMTGGLTVTTLGEVCLRRSTLNTTESISHERVCIRVTNSIPRAHLPRVDQRWGRALLYHHRIHMPQRATGRFALGYFECFHTTLKDGSESAFIRVNP